MLIMPTKQTPASEEEIIVQGGNTSTYMYWYAVEVSVLKHVSIITYVIEVRVLQGDSTSIYLYLYPAHVDVWICW